MAKLLRFLVILGLFTAPAFAIEINPQSIPPLGTTSGRWLVTVSIGHGMSKDAVLVLRNTLSSFFTSPYGGAYRHSIDLDDTVDPSFPSKAKFIETFQQLGAEIAAFRSQHPGAPAFVLIGIAAHGATDSFGNFHMGLGAKEHISGAELVGLVRALNSDETVMILQSCESGSLPNHDFPGTVLMAQNIRQLASEVGVRIAVVTPVNEVVSSPSNLWEQEILKPAFTNRANDRNGDGIVTYGEWKNGILRASCANYGYLPKSVLGEGGIDVGERPVGIDPQFYESGVPENLPLFLTEGGLRRYLQGTLDLTYDATPAKVWPETAQYCQEQAEWLLKAQKSQDFESLISLLSTTADIGAKNKLIMALKKAPTTPLLLEAVRAEFEKSSDSDYRLLCLRNLRNRGLVSGQNAETDRVLGFLFQAYPNAVPVIQAALLEQFYGSHYSPADPLFLVAMESPDELLRAAGVHGLDARQNPALIKRVIALLEHDASGAVRYEALQTLLRIGSEESIPALIRALSLDPDERVRGMAAYVLGVARVESAIPVLRKAAESDPSLRVRRSAKLALENMGVGLSAR